GLIGVNEIAGVNRRLLLDFVAGAGFTGIAVAMMGRNHPVGILFASLLFGALYQGGAEVGFEIPGFSRDMVVTLQGLVILFSGAAGGATGLLVVALPGACAIRVALSWLHGFACVNHAGDQVVSGMAINIIASGLTVVLAIAWYDQGGQTPTVPDAVRLKPLWP